MESSVHLYEQFIHRNRPMLADWDQTPTSDVAWRASEEVCSSTKEEPGVATQICGRNDCVRPEPSEEAVSPLPGQARLPKTQLRKPASKRDRGRILAPTQPRTTGAQPSKAQVRLTPANPVTGPTLAIPTFRQRGHVGAWIWSPAICRRSDLDSTLP